MIRFGNNVHVASKVDFITHDITHVMLNRRSYKTPGSTVKESIGCIEICDNVFIGSNTTVLQNVRISQNVIIGAGTLVNRDIPENSVACGVPAKIVGTFDEFLAKRMSQKTYPDDCKVSAETIDEHFAKWLWKEFYNIRVNK